MKIGTATCGNSAKGLIPRAALLVLMVLVLLSLSACAAKRNASVPGGVQGAKVQQEIDAFLTSYAAAFNERNIERLLAHYASDAVVHVGGDGEGFTLDKDSLAMALELKALQWNEDNVRIVGLRAQDFGTRENVNRLVCHWDIVSREWSGEYRVVFDIRATEQGWLILEENSPHQDRQLF